MMKKMMRVRGRAYDQAEAVRWLASQMHYNIDFQK
jgi:hypothetical protein